jgi:thiosulfate dehydrogenase [quinone] large subunit
MGSTTIQSRDAAASEIAPAETGSATHAVPASNGSAPASNGSANRGTQQPPPVGGPDVETLSVPAWLYRSHAASVLWLAVRLWLGYEWLNAGYQKIWGSEHSAFWFGNGVAVKGFATAGVLGSASGKSGASYGWWAGFLHNFVIPNASWIGKLVALGELLIGVALILGLLTGVAAFAGLLLNLTYMFSGSAGVNPMFAIASVFLILAWRNAGSIGLDRFIVGRERAQHHLGEISGRLTRRGVATVPG